MERARGNENADGEDGRTSSQSKDDSLTDFKSPKMDNAAKPSSGKLKIVTEKRPKKPSSKGKSSAGSKKKEGSASGRQSEKAQPSIESSFFKAGTTGKREGHTCPLCMRHFEDATAGTGHMKICAAKNKVSTTKLLAAVALQERQADERLAIGLPAGPLVQSKDKAPKRNRGATLKGDPDLQLALALSKSLQENQAERELEEALLLAAEHRGDEPMPGITDSQRRSTLKNFGFLTNKPVSDVPIKPRRKKHLGPTILQTRTQESRDRLLTERIAEILMGNEAITQVCRQESGTEVNNVEKPPVVLKSRLLKEIHISTKRLWTSAELSKGVTNFYVEALGAVVAPAVDRQRDDSATLSQRNPHPEADCLQHSEAGEVEADIKSEEMSRSPNDRTNDREDRVESPKNIYVTDREYRNNLPMDWSNTLNVSTMSDVVVLVDKNHIWAHKLVFHVRCSDILLDCQPIDDKRFRHVKEKISWLEVDYLTALAFLEFVYSGVIVKNDHVFTDDRIASLVRNLARKYRLKELFEYMRKRKAEIERRSEELEGRRSGLRSPIVIEVARRDRVVETVPDESRVVAEDKQEPGASTSSPCRSSCIVDLTVAKTPDIDVQLIEDDPPTIDTEPIDNASATGRNRSVTSPDIFDDTTEEAMEDAETNSPEASARVSTNENSNLRVLAQLIAEDNSSRPDEDNESDASSTASTFVDGGRSEESPESKRTNKNTSQGHIETPRSRSSSISSDSKKINDRKKSMSQRLPEKQKSNLSLFIEKVQRINAKSVLDSYTEEESLGEPYDRGRFRNPFNVDNESNRSISDVEGRAKGRLMAGKGALSALEEELMLHQEKKKNGIDPTSADESPVFDDSSMSRSLEGEAKDGRFMAGKRALGALEEQLMLQDEKKDNGIDLSLADESAVLNESSSTGHLDLEDSSVLDNATSTDEENISMYSRYKKTHKHNNSINKYRSLLIKLTEASAAASEDDDKRDGSTPRIDEAIDLTQESDSEVESSPTFKVAPSKKRCVRAIVSESSDSLVSRENDGTEDKSLTADDHNDAVRLSDDTADSFDDAETTSPLTKRAIDRDKRKNIASPVASPADRRKNLSTSPEYPDLQVRENEEMFGRSSTSRRTLTPSPRLSTDSTGKSVSRRGKRKSNEGESKDTKFVDNFEEKEKSHRPDRSSRGTDSLSNFSQCPDLHVLDVDEEIFTQSVRSRRTLTPSPRRSTDSAEKSVSRRCKRKSDESCSKDTNFIDKLQKNEESHRARGSSRGTDSLSNFSQYPDLHVLDVDEEIFTQSLRSRRTLTPSPRRSTDSAEKSVSRRCKRKSDERRSKAMNLVDNSKDNEKLHLTSRSSRGTDSLNNSSKYPDLDVFEVDEDIFAQSFERPLSPSGALTPSLKPSSGSSSRKRGSDESEPKDTSIVDVSEKGDEEEASLSDGRKKRRSSPRYSDFNVFEANDQVFTQSFRSPSLSPRRALTPSPSYGTTKDDERGRNETPRVPSPILISSSPDMDPDTARPATNTQDSNKENSFLAADDNAVPFYSGRNTLSPPRLDEPSSAKSGPSRRRLSPECGGISPSPAKNPLVRWNSMPTSTTNAQRLKRTRTPTKSSRLVLSQGVTPPVNYDAMDTPELKRELEKYGIKPQKAHRARQLLTHIYNELHSEVPTTASDAASDEDEEPPAKKIGRSCSQSSEDSEPESVTSAVSVIPEEMEFADGDAPPNENDDVSNKSSVKQAFTALIKEDKELQNKMLTYEPLPLELLHSMLKARGFRCKINDLMDFLDEECITFRVQDQARRQKGNRGRGKKTAATGTRRPKSQKS